MRGRFLLAPVIALGLVASACGGDVPSPSAAQVFPIGVADAAEAPATVAAPQPTATAAPARVQPPFVLRPEAWGTAPVSLGLTAPATSAAAAVVYDEGSGELLHAVNAEQRLAPASLTKIITAIIIIESGLDLDAPVTIDVDSRTMVGSSVMGIIPGDVFTVRDLLYGLMLPSGNDAALALGRYMSGSDRAFVELMNDWAWDMGLRETHFANAHGLSNPNHYTTARELAHISRYAMANPVFAEIVRAGSHMAIGHYRTLVVNNVNSYMWQVPGADGLKTGFTYRAGKTLVASATRNGHRLYVVLLNAPSREADAALLTEWGFANFRWE
ncbi:MAG: D-alanyl-D-alanine carboxypeptidase [Dehalococcoidia bacterium]|nr:D-alanyl-D-alanine carboxypeptidase [Dehalococcoidia bacterium]